MWILVSQNHPKTLPKSFQNGWLKKHVIFQRILTIMFLFLYRGFLKNINFTQVKSIILKFSLRECFRNFHTFFFQKTIQKSFQIDVQTLTKSMSKMCCFSASIFSGFGLDFGASWTSNLEPSWPFWPPNIVGEQHFYLLKLNVS